MSRFYGIIIRMYYNDHNPPHFHAEYQGQKVEYDIQTMEILAGSISKKAHNLVVEWANIHREELMNNWIKASVMIKLEKIKPLS